MSDPTGTTPSCLAVTEKRSHRPGGCVGMFLQLFDWNRRFAKKKFFSRKLLPPARAKPSRRFGGDEKRPKSTLHLIPDHSHGVFPNMKKSDKHGYSDSDHKNEMRSPGLVARLMGLESLPAVSRDKPKKASSATNVLDMRDEKLVTVAREYNGEYSISERGHRQIELRPQKIQRTGSLERRAVTRLGAEAFQLKAVLSRPRKHHHPKLSPPIKSPRLSTSKNASRTSKLFDAATRILEPGLQATNKARSSLTYTSPLLYSSEDQMMTERMKALVAERPIKACHEMSINQSSMGETSCKNCGTLIEAAVCNPLEEQGSGYPSFASNAADAPSQMHEDTFPSPCPWTVITSSNLVGDVISQRSQGHPISFPGLDKNRKQCNKGLDGYRMPASQDGEALWESVKRQKDEHLPCAFEQRLQTQSQMPVNRETTPPRAKFTTKRPSSTANAVNHQVKDFVALNRNLSRYTRHRVASKMEDSHLKSQKKYCDEQDGSFTQLRIPAREWRNTSVNGKVQNGGSVSLLHGIDRKPRYDIAIAKEMLTAHPMNRAGNGSRSVGQRIVSKCKGAIDGDVSFPFKLNTRAGTYAGRNGKRKDQDSGTGGITSFQMKAISGEAKSLQDNVPLTEDGLAVLLEQKLKELASQEKNELRTEYAQSKRSTVTILRELISALTAEHCTCQDNQLDNSDAASQTEEEVLISWAQQFDHLSPGSVLEASFSNNSCVSSSLDDNSGNYQYMDSVDYLNEESQMIESDEDILDSAASMKKEMTSSEMVTSLVDHISHMLSNINQHDVHLSGDRHIHVEEVMRRAEVLFGKPMEADSCDWMDGILLPFVQDEVETLAAAMQLDFDSLLGVEHTKQQLRHFLLDCAVECFDSKYGRWCNNIGYRSWRRLASSMKGIGLIQEVGRAVRKWRSLGGMVCDELIEREMSDSVGNWREFESEGFEAGGEIDDEILGGLVEEVVVELWGWEGKGSGVC